MRNRPFRNAANWPTQRPRLNPRYPVSSSRILCSADGLACQSVMPCCPSNTAKAPCPLRLSDRRYATGYNIRNRGGAQVFPGGRSRRLRRDDRQDRRSRRDTGRRCADQAAAHAIMDQILIAQSFRRAIPILLSSSPFASSRWRRPWRDGAGDSSSPFSVRHSSHALECEKRRIIRYFWVKRLNCTRYAWSRACKHRGCRPTEASDR